MKLVRHVHARSMLRRHAAFWRHAQTVALATTLSEINLTIASAHHALLRTYFIFVLPSHWARPSAISVIFFDFHVFRISCPRFPPKIPGSDSGYSHLVSARGGPSSARACPPSRPSPPSPFFAEVQGTLFLAFGQFTKRGFSATTFLGARRVLWCLTPQNPTGTGPLCGPARFH